MAYKPSRADNDRAQAETPLEAAAATSPVMLELIGISGRRMAMGSAPYGCSAANMLPLGAPVGGRPCRQGLGGKDQTMSTKLNRAALDRRGVGNIYNFGDLPIPMGAQKLAGRVAAPKHGMATAYGGPAGSGYRVPFRFPVAGVPRAGGYGVGARGRGPAGSGRRYPSDLPYYGVGGGGPAGSGRHYPIHFPVAGVQKAGGYGVGRGVGSFCERWPNSVFCKNVVIVPPGCRWDHTSQTLRCPPEGQRQPFGLTSGWKPGRPAKHGTQVNRAAIARTGWTTRGRRGTTRSSSRGLTMGIGKSMAKRLFGDGLSVDVQNHGNGHYSATVNTQGGSYAHRVFGNHFQAEVARRGNGYRASVRTHTPQAVRGVGAGNHVHDIQGHTGIVRKGGVTPAKKGTWASRFTGIGGCAGRGGGGRMAPSGMPTGVQYGMRYGVGDQAATAGVFGPIVGRWPGMPVVGR